MRPRARPRSPLPTRRSDSRSWSRCTSASLGAFLAVPLISLPEDGVPAGGHAEARPKESKVRLMPPAGVIASPATVETSEYPCLVERVFLRSRWRVNAPGQRSFPAHMTIPSDVRAVRYPAESRPATSGGVRGKAPRRL